MNKTRHRNFFTVGLGTSLLWHFFWSFLVVPVVVPPKQSAYLASRSIFLGSILNDADLSGYKVAGESENKRFSFPVDLSRDVYFTKDPSSLSKPKTEIASVKKPSPAMQTLIPSDKISKGPVKSVVFGMHDYSDYLDHVDFGELSRISYREDIASYINLRLLVGQAGSVEDIKKVSGCGDPIVDLYIIRKLKTAIFKEFVGRGKWLDVRIKLK